MTQIEQIKAELQKRLLKYDPDMTNAGRELQEVLAFIDSLPAESPDFEAEWKRYTASREDDMRTNAVTMNVKEVAKHFTEWQKKQMMKEAVEGRYMKTIDGKVYAESGNLPISKDAVKCGDKVKLIILKEDE